jgi:hypothetical protein
MPRHQRGEGRSEFLWSVRAENGPHTKAASRCHMLSSSLNWGVSIKASARWRSAPRPRLEQSAVIADVFASGTAFQTDVMAWGEQSFSVPASRWRTGTQVEYLIHAVDFAVDGSHRATDRKSHFVVVEVFLPRNIVGKTDRCTIGTRLE